MKKSAKIWLITAAALMMAGIILCAVAAWGFSGSLSEVLEGELSGLSTVEYVKNTHEPQGDFDSISIDTNTADIYLLPSEDGKCRVVCYEEPKLTHSVKVENGTLSIQLDDRKYRNEIIIGINFEQTTVHVYLPEEHYKKLTITEDTGDIEIPESFLFEAIDIETDTGDVVCSASVSGHMKAKTDTGDISLENLSAGSMELSTDTGRITAQSIVCGSNITVDTDTGDAHLNDISCTTLFAEGDTGDFFLKSFIASEKLDIETNTGDVHFEACDAAGILILTDTGYVKGSLLSEKIFIAESDTGDIDVPRGISGGICEIETSTGDIKIEILP